MEAQIVDGRFQIAVVANGTGRRTSDKAAYRFPTRSAQRRLEHHRESVPVTAGTRPPEALRVDEWVHRLCRGQSARPGKLPVFRANIDYADCSGSEGLHSDHPAITSRCEWRK